MRRRRTFTTYFLLLVFLTPNESPILSLHRPTYPLRLKLIETISSFSITSLSSPFISSGLFLFLSFMAITTVTATTTVTTKTTPPLLKPRKVCFSFAAYSKNVIDHLKSCEIPVIEGLTDLEVSNIETSFNFVFPPDLRQILCEGLPVGPGFPNWRSSSIQQLEILMNLPILGILKEISKGNFWCESWGKEPEDREESLSLAKVILKKAPILVPIYRYCYIPSTPNSGNPVFYVHDGDSRYSGFDVAGFFQQIEFRQKHAAAIRPVRLESPVGSATVKAPAWAAKEAKRVEVWSDLVENGMCKGKNGTCRENWRDVLGDYFEEMSWRLRDGGWRDEEVNEMMSMTVDKEMDEDESTTKQKQKQKQKKAKRNPSLILRNKESVVMHVRFLSVGLLRSGWSKQDIIYALGFSDSVFADIDNLLDIDFPASKQSSPTIQSYDSFKVK